MKIQLQCPLCKFSMAINPKKKKFGTAYYTIYNTDNNICEVQHGSAMHSTAVYFTNYKFDLLFESGLNALKDLYYREAVASLTTAMERFFEYGINILIFDNNPSKTEKGWKYISNQSERQLGAFYFLYLSKFNELPQTLDSNETGFRNNVIHKGYFPTKDETLNFAKKIYSIIQNNNKVLEENLPTNISEYKRKFIQELRENCASFCEDEHKLINPTSPYKFVRRPFQRRLKTYLFEGEDFSYREMDKFEAYINSINTMQID